ncbi:hypothetical protein L873DRAFT_1316516 [Choiromyces venosus 120613-1]|uniref:Uncharacterized protein n=1 Tax=Choiromyces venosus 120613-1 TaxID=1336337 RepID=A0A3N4JE30_9PEZI|nr:hypothetical protein L873DRAFT_1316516 [Choiromyces venosus 120613-1]
MTEELSPALPPCDPDNLSILSANRPSWTYITTFIVFIATLNLFTIFYLYTVTTLVIETVAKRIAYTITVKLFTRNGRNSDNDPKRKNAKIHTVSDHKKRGENSSSTQRQLNDNLTTTMSSSSS